MLAGGGRIAVATCLAASLAACAIRNADEPAGGVTELDFLVFGDPEELRAYREVVAAFEGRQDTMRVNLIEASDRADLLTRLSTSFAGGRPPDLFLINYRFFGQFASRDVLEPLGDRFEASSVFEADDFYAEALEAFRFRDQQVCLPQNISSLVVYYNEHLFDAAGVVVPSTGWTWADMVQAAVSLTVDNDGDGVADQHGLGVEPSIIRVAPFIWSNGGELVDDEHRPTRFTLHEPAAREALRAFIDLGRLPIVIPNENEVESEDLESRFLNGRLAMYMSSRRSTPTFRTITEFGWDVAPLPLHREPAGILHSDAYCMTAASEHKDEAWQFVEFALSSDGQTITAQSGRTVPSMVQVSTSDAFLDPEQEPANSQVFLDTIPHIRRVPNISTWPEIEDAAEPILEEALYEGLPLEAVIERLDAATTDIFARAEH